MNTNVYLEIVIKKRLYSFSQKITLSLKKKKLNICFNLDVASDKTIIYLRYMYMSPNHLFEQLIVTKLD